MARDLSAGSIHSSDSGLKDHVKNESLTASLFEHFHVLLVNTELTSITFLRLMRLYHQTQVLHDFGFCHSLSLLSHSRPVASFALGLISTCCSFCQEPFTFGASCGWHITVIWVSACQTASQTPSPVPSPSDVLLFYFLYSYITTWFGLFHSSVHKNVGFTRAGT